MKKICLYTLVAAAALFISCNNDSSSGSVADYINPGFSTKTVLATKDYSIATFDWGAPSGSCQAISYQGKVNNIRYVGFAAKNGTSFNFKIYWPASSMPSGTISISGCTIILNEDRLTDQTLTVTINDEADDTYTLTFTSTITLPHYSINSGHFIRGQAY